MSWRLPTPWIAWIGASLLGCGGATAPESPAAEPPPCTRPGRPLLAEERGTLGEGGACFTLDLAAGEAVRLGVDQGGGDLVTRVEDSRGALLLTFDTPVGARAPERPCFAAPSAGRFRVRLEAFEKAAATYSVRLLVKRQATEGDLACASAARLFAETQSGQGETAAADLERAAGLWREAGEPLSETVAWREAARALEFQGRPEKAARALHEAREAAERADSSFLFSSTLTRLAAQLHYAGKVDEATALAKEAFERAIAVGDRQMEAIALGVLALGDELRGDSYKALNRLSEAEAIQRELGLGTDLAETLWYRATNLAILDYHQEALEVLEEACPLVRGTVELEARCLMETGWVHRLQGDPEKAVAALSEALALWSRQGNRPGQAAVLDRLGTALQEAGKPQEALAAYQASLRLVSTLGKPARKAHTMVNLSCLHAQMGETPPARYWLKRVEREHGGDLDPKARAHVEYCAAQLGLTEGDLEGALEQIEAALEIVEELKGTSRKQGARHRPIWLWQDYAELRVALLLALAREQGRDALAEAAFSAADRARARSLSEIVLEAQLPRPPADGAEEEALRERLGFLLKRRAQLAGRGIEDPEAAQVEVEIGRLSLDMKALEASRRAGDSGLSSLASPEPASLAAVQAFLPPGSALLQYFLAEESYLFVVTPSDLAVHVLPSRKVIEAHATDLREALRTSHHEAAQADLAARSTAKILLPGDAVPKGIERLFVVPDGALHYLPFAVLPAPGTSVTDASAAGTLIDRYVIRYLPSSAVGLALHRRALARPRTQRSIRLFADPVFSKDDERLGGVGSPASPSRAVQLERLPDGPLPRLCFTDREAREILSLFEPEERSFFLGFDASKEAVLDPRLAEARILHFATHAFVDERFPSLSGLVLSRRDPRGLEIDGNLFLYEIFRLRLNADLVVLSGCQTALGPRVRGDGLLGMTRGFFYAGGSQVLVSLWSVDDRATAALMAELYRRMLQDGEEPAAALRSAQIWLRQQKGWSAPYYWAPFVVQGVEPSS